MPVNRMLSELSSREITEWQCYFIKKKKMEEAQTKNKGKPNKNATLG